MFINYYIYIYLILYYFTHKCPEVELLDHTLYLFKGNRSMGIFCTTLATFLKV